MKQNGEWSKWSIYVLNELEENKDARKRLLILEKWRVRIMAIFGIVNILFLAILGWFINYSLNKMAELLGG